MSKGDGRNPKFRLLCKKCNSYQYTDMHVMVTIEDHWHTTLGLHCRKCENTASDLKEEFERE